MENRTRRLRRNLNIRNMVAETMLDPSDFIYPLFIIEGINIKEEISSMPGVYRHSIDRLGEELDELVSLDIHSVLLFGIPKHKDECGSEGYSENGIIQEALRYIKKNYPNIYVITDVCMCEYTSHGHCGILDESGYVKNDETLEYLAKISLSHAKAGADMIAPSDMMDGRVSKIRHTLDANGFENIPIMAYSAKYSSSYYGPFRDAADSAPSFGDRKTYQMDYRNSDEALREMEIDIAEGADIIMVKPALSYLDVIRRAKDNLIVPIAAYNVSGEYSMLLNAVSSGILAEEVIMESIMSIKRAGAKIIISYFAKDIVKKLRGL